jgi:hypothetical protein
MSNPFDYLNAILQNKKQLIVDELTEKDYSPFMVNRGLSYHKDCIMYANEMNSRHLIDKKLQNDFLLNTIRSQKRPFTKWAKPINREDLACVKQVYGFSNSKAKEALSILSDDQIKYLKDQTDVGGLKT